MRAQWHLPITGPILQFIGCELLIEDHDLVRPLALREAGYF